MTKTVAKRSAASDKMVQASEKGRALMGGTGAMRAAGERYLPKFPAETHEAYRARLNSSWLFNGYRKTVRDMSGRVFDKPIEVEDVAPPLSDWLANIDLAGRDLSTFARQVFEDGLDAGIAYVMVDAPPRQQGVTQAQAQAQNLRPYLVHLAAEDVLGWKAETVDNVMTLTQLRIMETATEPDPKDEFAQIEVDQVRVLDRTPGGVQTRIYRKVKSASGAESWELHDEPTISGMDEITVVPFYANRTGFFTGEPMLDDLADVNVAHWQSQSDQRNILHFARVPVLFQSGISDDDGPVVISAGMVSTATDPNADMKWVEHSGSAIGAGRQDLKDLEFQMEAHGLQLLAARPGAQSATGEALDAAKETSALAMTADQLQDALEQALQWMLAYAGAEQEITVKVNKDFGVTMMTAQELGVLLNAVNTGNLSRQTFIAEMARRGAIRGDIVAEEEEDRIGTADPALTGEGLELGT